MSNEPTGRRITVVRHADALMRPSFEGRDRERPLTELGRQQAEALGELLATRRLAGIVSSPAVRCLETVDPLVRRTGARLETDDALAESSSGEGAFRSILDAARRLDEGEVIAATHGPVFERLFDEVATLRVFGWSGAVAKSGRLELVVENDEVTELSVFPAPVVQ